MIRKLVLRRFKRFCEETFEFPGHVVLAGPNNSGKTTVLQAIAAWDLAMRHWREAFPGRRHAGHPHARIPIGRRDFTTVPLRAYDLLWSDRVYGGPSGGPIEIEVTSDAGWVVALEFEPDTSEQIFVRPRNDTDDDAVRSADLHAVFVPPMTGIVIEEPLYATEAFLGLQLSLGRPGDVLRNLLWRASQDGAAWAAVAESIHRLFGYEILRPGATGAHVVAEYRPAPAAKPLDIASAGSGFQQVLMLLTFLHTRPASLLLLDEPDAHLHVILQDAIYGELRRVAAERNSQVIVATHSEIVIDSVDPSEVCVLFRRPRRLADSAEKRTLIESLGILSNTDVMLACAAPGVLYTEDRTDLDILRAWARTLAHPALGLLTTRLFWRKSVGETREGGSGIPAKDHYAALKLVRDDLPGLEILDRDGNPHVRETELVGKGLQRVRWRRYEIESYLLHPDALARFVAGVVGPGDAAEHERMLREHFERKYPPDFLADPFGDFPFVSGTKARTELLPPALSAAGVPGVPHTQFHEIAAVMLPAEIHPEVTEKLDAICRAFGVAP